jgi:glucose-1-phosphate adenylyltransferase
MDDVVTIVLGGGRGTRLFPLTLYRSKPAVPIGGSYRLVDVAVSNCIHAGLRRIFVITQYQSESLNRHVANAYKFDAFSQGAVDILAAEQSEDGGNDWFRGTADAVRKCMKHLEREHWNRIAILSGDQLYRMKLGEMLGAHRDANAAVTVAMKAVPAEQASAFGIMKTDASGRVLRFVEKPPRDRLAGLDSPIPPKSGAGTSGRAGQPSPAYLASMGIYIFERAALEKALKAPEDHIDFGKHVIPAMLERTRVQSYLYDDYWEDVGTIRSYFDANIALTTANSSFSFYHPRYPIFMDRPFLAPTKIHNSRVADALVADGGFLEQVDVESSVLGPRTRIGRGAKIRRSLILGADFYDDDPAPSPPLGIGEGSVIENAIVDKNARIGRNVRINNASGRPDHDGKSYFIREGLVIIPKNGVIADGTVI